MNVILISQALHPKYGGSAFSESSLAAALVRKGHHVVVLAPKGSVDPEFVSQFGKVTVREFRKLDWVFARMNRNHPLRQLIHGASVVHVNGHWHWENFFISKVCRAEKKPYILQPRGMLWFGHRKIFLKRVFQMLLGKSVVRWATKVVALSRFEIRQWAPFGIPNEKITVLPNGVLQSTIGANARAHDPQGTPPYFLYLGRLERRKNLLFLLRAYQQYRRAGGKAELKLVGPAERNHDRELRRAILRMGLGSHVLLMGPSYQGEKQSLLAAATAVVYPAIEEPFGRVPFEALAEGSLAIVPEQSGAAEYIAPFIPEMIYPEGDVSRLARALARSEKYRVSSERELSDAKEWVRSELHWDTVVRRYEDLYQNVEKSASSV